MTDDWIALTVDEWIAAPALTHEGRTVIHLLDSRNLQIRARIAIDGAQHTGVRIHADRLIAFAGCGRTIVVSLTSGAVLREHRLT